MSNNFLSRIKRSVSSAFANCFGDNVGNIVLMAVAALLLISLLISPAVIIALALFGLFLWALLYC
ncbi:MAG: hypothetical protein IIZ45_04800 [Firmicutes bacterium]|nr:hypothetical protein [Bacillota bacterium]